MAPDETPVASSPYQSSPYQLPPLRRWQCPRCRRVVTAVDTITFSRHSQREFRVCVWCVGDLCQAVIGVLTPVEVPVPTERACEAWMTREGIRTDTATYELMVRAFAAGREGR